MEKMHEIFVVVDWIANKMPSYWSPPSLLAPRWLKWPVMSHSQQQSAPGPLPTAPDSPAMGVTVSGNVTKYAMKKKKILNAEESELFELTQAAGIAMDQEVFKYVWEGASQ